VTQNKPQKDYLAEPVRDFIAATAARTPTPGGGSVAGVVGALAAALGEMSLNYTRGKKKFAAHEEHYAQVAPRLARARGMFEDLVADDVAAYELYCKATAMPDGDEKDAAVQVALAASIDVPREAAKLALALLGDLQGLADKCSRWLVSDLLAAAALAVATVRLCDYNVRINTPALDDAGQAAELRESSADDVKHAVRVHGQMERQLRETLP